MKAIVLGCGRQGALLVRLLEEENVDVTVIDNNPKSFTRLEGFKGKKVLGDGMKEQILVRAGIKDAESFAAVTNSDNINLVAAQIARGIFQVPRVICRVYDPHRAAVYSDLGLDTVNFSKTGAHLLMNYITTPEASRKYPLGDGTVTTIEFPVHKSFSNKTISELNMPGLFQVGAVIRGVRAIIAEPDVTIQAGDKLFGIAQVVRLKEILDHFGGTVESQVTEHPPAT